MRGTRRVGINSRASTASSSSSSTEARAAGVLLELSMLTLAVLVLLFLLMSTSITVTAEAAHHELADTGISKMPAEDAETADLGDLSSAASQMQLHLAEGTPNNMGNTWLDDRMQQQPAIHDRSLLHEEQSNVNEMQATSLTSTDLKKKLANGGSKSVKMELIAKKLRCSQEHGEVPTGEATEAARFMFCLVRRSAARANFLRAKKIKGDQLVPKLSNGISKMGKTSSHNSNPNPHSQANVHLTSYETASSTRIDEWVMTIQLGTPIQTFVVIIDTGSDLTWVQCEPCLDCYTQQDPYFDPAESSSYSAVSCFSSECGELPYYACEQGFYCEYVYLYGDGSGTVGELATETVSMTTTTGATVGMEKVLFGCGSMNSGSFGDLDADGLVGLGQGPLSLISQLGSEFGNRFAYCFVNREDAESVTSPLFFGDAGMPSGDDILYTPIVANQAYPTYYYVDLVGISVDGTALSFASDTFATDSEGNGGLIVDSGTTITQLQDTVYSLLEEAFKERISYPSATTVSGFTLCYNTSGVEKPEFPDLAFHFDGANIILPLDNYFIAVDDENTYCLILMSTGDNDSISIYGNWQQQNFWMLYDLQNARIGFKPTICDQVEG